MPFGDEVISGAGRSSGNGWNSTTAPRQKFTAYERDNESGLDFAQARYFGNSLGRFNSPDPLMASSNTSNPQSYNRYTYALNNPLYYVDPDGEKARISVSIDKKNNTGVITISASFAIYDKGNSMSDAEFEREAKKFEEQVISSFSPSGAFNKDGIRYTVLKAISNSLERRARKKPWEPEQIILSV